MENPGNDNNDDGSQDFGQNSARRFFWMLVLLMGIIALFLMSNRSGQEAITYDFFLKQIEDKNILQLKIVDSTAEGRFKTRPEAPLKYNEKTNKFEAETDANGKRKLVDENFRVTLPRDTVSQGQLNAVLDKHPEIQRIYNTASGSIAFFYFLLLGLPFAILLMMYLSNRRREQMMGGGFLSGFSKSPAKRYESAKQAITFADVAGLQGVKADLQEIVDYLRSPEKFQKLGGRVPKGVLLNGPPGTGKTLLARAVAGEANVPFFSVNGSEFIQMFVGVGASRVRDLFRTAKETGSAIIFIDEIDAVGRQRGAGLGGGHDEREQTLNQILSEMDGFSPVDSVIVLAATNRPDVLDPALLRPGRFDRHITVGRPTHQGRVEIFNVHVRNVPLDDDVDIDSLASATIGMTGADIRNVVNEAALWAARQDKNRVSMGDFDYARDKVLMGAKREEELMDEEREKTAYHEAGHTLAAWYLKGADRVRKVTIVPRGRSLGSTQIMPGEDRLSISRSQLMDQLVVALGGRAAEEIIYDEMTVGAENDLERGTATARRMVTHWGMSDRLGPVSYKMSDDDPFLGRELHQQRQFSERTMEEIDAEVTKILREAESRAIDLLRHHRKELDLLTVKLLEQEELDENEIMDLIGPSVHEDRRKALDARRAAQRERLAAKEAARQAKREKEEAAKAQAAAEEAGSAGKTDGPDDTSSGNGSPSPAKESAGNNAGHDDDVSEEVLKKSSSEPTSSEP